MAFKVLLQCAALLIVASFCTGVAIQSRRSWGASAPRTINKVRSHVQYVIIHHTKDQNGCSESEHCKQLIRNAQLAHKRRNFVDIGYNFIVAGDGKVYKGRGFGVAGQHASTLNYNSIGIGFLGDFEDELPSPEMLDNAKELIEQAVSQGYLKSDYILWGHRQEKSTNCPGTALFNEIKTWPHWSGFTD